MRHLAQPGPDVLLQACGESAGPHVWKALLCQSCDVSVRLQVRLARQHQRVIKVCAVESSTQHCACVILDTAGPLCGSAGLIIWAKAEPIHDCCVRTKENRLQVRRAAHGDSDVYDWPASNRPHSLPTSPTAPPKPDGQSRHGLLHRLWAGQAIAGNHGPKEAIAHAKPGCMGSL